MSDHPKEAQRNLKRIVICADICLAVFHWLPPAKVGLELALVSCRFDALVDAHFRSRRWALGKLEIVKSCFGDQIVKIGDNGLSKTLPISWGPPPNDVVGFERIKIRYASDDIVDFLQSIGCLLQSDITLELFGIYAEDDVLGDNLFPDFIWPLLNASVSIVKMHFKDSEFFHNLHYIISPTVLCDCANLRQITFTSKKIALQFPPDDSAGASEWQALCKWLHTPLADGRPKVLRTRYPFGLYSFVNTTMAELKREFLNASSGVSFIITSIVYGGVLSPFEVENPLTNEGLAMRSIGNGRWMVMRSPIGKNAAQWAEWEREALEKDCIGWKVLEFGH